MSSSEILETQAPLSDGSWDTTIYVILSLGIVFGLSIIATISIGICKCLKRPKEDQPPPSPMCKRQVSIHAQYPPTPHVTRLPKVRRGFSRRNTSFKMSINLPKRFQNRASWKIGSITSPAKKFRTFSINRRRSSVDSAGSAQAENIHNSAPSVVIPMPNEDLPSVNQVPEPMTA